MAPGSSPGGPDHLRGIHPVLTLPSTLSGIHAMFREHEAWSTTKKLLLAEQMAAELLDANKRIDGAINEFLVSRVQLSHKGSYKSQHQT